MKLPDDISEAPISALVLLEEVRQAQLMIAISYLNSCYMKFKTEIINTGEAYSSPSSVIAMTAENLNAGEAIRALEFAGFTVVKILHETSWKEKIAKTIPQVTQ